MRLLSGEDIMNIKLIFKTLLIIAVLALLVLMGMNNNTERVTLSMPWILPHDHQSLPAALMYYAFFAVGFLVGAIMMAGGKKGGSSKANKVQT
jgi:uncharacterized integral membrane protein